MQIADSNIGQLACYIYRMRRTVLMSFALSAAVLAACGGGSGSIQQLSPGLPHADGATASLGTVAQYKPVYPLDPQRVVSGLRFTKLGSACEQSTFTPRSTRNIGVVAFNITPDCEIGSTPPPTSTPSPAAEPTATPPPANGLAVVVEDLTAGGFTVIDSSHAPYNGRYYYPAGSVQYKYIYGHIYRFFLARQYTGSPPPATTH